MMPWLHVVVVRSLTKISGFFEMLFIRTEFFLIEFKTMKRLVVMGFALFIVGCSAKTDERMGTGDQPLTVEEWRHLSVAEKYEPETLEQLRMNDPDFLNEGSWNRFMRDVVVPERRKDIPTHY